MTPSKLNTALGGIVSTLVSLTAPIVVPIALVFTDKDAKELAFSWYDTPDELELMDLQWNTSIRKIHERYGFWIAAYVWFGWRNRAHGFASKMFGREAPGYWPQSLGDLSQRRADSYWLLHRRFGNWLFVWGWQVYRSTSFSSGFEYRPKFTVKYRPQGSKKLP